VLLVGRVKEKQLIDNGTYVGYIYMMVSIVVTYWCYQLTFLVHILTLQITSPNPLTPTITCILL